MRLMSVNRPIARLLFGSAIATVTIVVFSGCMDVVGKEDKAPPGEVVDFNAVAGDGTITLTWYNPTDEDFNDVRITYGTQGVADEPFTGTVDPTGTIVSELVNDTEYTFTIRAVDVAGNTSEGVTVAQTPFAGGGTQVPVAGVSLSPDSLHLKVGQTDTVTTVIDPQDASDQRVTWISSDESVATVDPSGVVTAEGLGSATVAVMTSDGNYVAVCAVLVTVDGYVPVESVSVAPFTLDLGVDVSHMLAATILPANASNADVSWTSSDESVATVTSIGVVRGVSGGTATIVATSVDGDITGSCSVTVSASGGPTAPTIVRAVPVALNSLQVTWTDNSNNESGFEVQARLYDTDGNALTDWFNIGTTGVNVTTASGPPWTSPYGESEAFVHETRVRVRALGSEADSPWTAEYTVSDLYEATDGDEGDYSSVVEIEEGYDNWGDPVTYRGERQFRLFESGETDWIWVDIDEAGAYALEISGTGDYGDAGGATITRYQSDGSRSLISEIDTIDTYSDGGGGGPFSGIYPFEAGQYLIKIEPDAQCGYYINMPYFGDIYEVDDEWNRLVVPESGYITEFWNMPDVTISGRNLVNGYHSSDNDVDWFEVHIWWDDEIGSNWYIDIGADVQFAVSTGSFPDETSYDGNGGEIATYGPYDVSVGVESLYIRVGGSTISPSYNVDIDVYQN